MSGPNQFKCDACGKTYAWKPELAGKKVRCKCGGVIVVPKPVEPAHSDEDNSLDDLYALSGDNHPKIEQSNAGLTCPSCKSEAAVGAMICVNCGLNFQTGQRIGAVTAAPALAVAGAGGGARPQTLGYAGRNVAKEKEALSDQAEANKMLIPPAIVLALGLGVTFFYAMFCLKLSLAHAFIYVSVTTVINVLMITIGLFLAMKMLDFSLGTPLLALLKTGAIAMLPGAIDNLIDYYGGPMGGFVGWGVAVLFYYGLLMWFFDLDGMEVYIVTAIFWLIRTWLGMFVVIFLLSSIMSLAPSSSTGSSPPVRGVSSSFFGSSKSVKLDGPGGNVNRRAQYWEVHLGTKEAEEYFKKNPTAHLINYDHDQSVKIVKDLYDAGAEQLRVADIVPYHEIPQVEKMIVDMPDDPAERAAIMKLVDPIFGKRDCAPIDYGPDMVYMMLDFDFNDNDMK